MPEQSVVLSLDSVRKAFGGVVAVRDLSLSVVHNCTHALIGPNGAGKTTLFNLITGEIPLDSGTIQLFKTDVTHSPVQRRRVLGLGRTYQVPNLFWGLTVKESLFLACERQDANLMQMVKPWLRCPNYIDRAKETAWLVDLEDQFEMRVANLSHGEHRRLGIAIAIAGNPRILLLDEPAAGLTISESKALVRVINGLKSKVELTVVLIDHDISFVFSLVDYITVMDQGSVLITGTPDEVQANPQVQQVYYGGSRNEG